ncbi:unnamed protein product [Clonostachys byssicola]|uniref:Uncharacterized protein n=1 Tax=Clonostachys byssicola TaxID=160290 RepID=A0A9N9XZW2_9HYPO|nr:unnamed protein product [Clonostachys byssicola]
MFNARIYSRQIYKGLATHGNGNLKPLGVMKTGTQGLEHASTAITRPRVATPNQDAVYPVAQGGQDQFSDPEGRRQTRVAPIRGYKAETCSSSHFDHRCAWRSGGSQGVRLWTEDPKE